jgi:hypothetical protein
LFDYNDNISKNFIYNTFKHNISEILRNKDNNKSINEETSNNEELKKNKDVIKNIFIDDIYDKFMILMNIFINDNLREEFTDEEISIFKYKTKKYYYANRFSSLVEYNIFNDTINDNTIINDNLNNDNSINYKTINDTFIIEINTKHNITNINLLFFICASYALLDTYIDNDNYLSTKDDNTIKYIQLIFNKYFNLLLNNNDSDDDSDDDTITDNNRINNYSNKIVNSLSALINYIELDNLDSNIISTIKYCFNLEIECYFTQSSPNQTNEELVFMMIKKGLSSLILSFITKSNYLEKFIDMYNNTDNDITNNKQLKLLLDFGIFGQLIDDICDYVEDTEENKYVITSYKSEHIYRL